jgi:hypothetical protein
MIFMWGKLKFRDRGKSLRAIGASAPMSGPTWPWAPGDRHEFGARGRGPQVLEWAIRGPQAGQTPRGCGAYS